MICFEQLRKDRSFLGRGRNSIRQLLPPQQDAHLCGHCFVLRSFALLRWLRDDNGLRGIILVWLLFLIDLFYNQSQYIVFCRRVLLAVVEDSGRRSCRTRHEMPHAQISEATGNDGIIQAQHQLQKHTMLCCRMVKIKGARMYTALFLRRQNKKFACTTRLCRRNRFASMF